MIKKSYGKLQEKITAQNDQQMMTNHHFFPLTMIISLVSETFTSYIDKSDGALHETISVQNDKNLTSH